MSLCPLAPSRQPPGRIPPHPRQTPLDSLRPLGLGSGSSPSAGLGHSSPKDVALFSSRSSCSLGAEGG